MFFVIGVAPREKQLQYSQLVVCSNCGKYGRYEVWTTCMCFSMFFIPVFKWNHQYFVRANCCGEVYALDPAIGRAIAKGAEIEIKPEHLHKVSGGKYKRCGFCGYEAAQDFQFCPKCGKPLE